MDHERLVRQLTFGAAAAGGSPARVDRYLRDALGAHVGRRRLAALIAAGAVRVNGRRARKGTMLRAGDEITVALDALAGPLRPTSAPLVIIHCDAELVAVDKAPGMPSTAGARARSVAAALLDRFPEMAALDPIRGAGLVHRLDSGTSGLLLAARTPDAYRRLRAAFSAKALCKEYLAVVRGRLDRRGRIALPLARAGRRRMVVSAASRVSASRRTWAAETSYEPLARAPDATLVRLRMRSGVTHQLRAHLAHLGCAVLGDTRYGRANDATDGGWHYLHAARITADDPDLLPADLATPFPEHWAPLFERLGWLGLIGSPEIIGGPPPEVHRPPG